MPKLFLFAVSIVLAIIILTNEGLHELIATLGKFEYLGGFLIGVFFVLSFTVVPAVATLLVLADLLNPFLLAIIAGLGAMMGDYVIYRFFRSQTDEITKAKVMQNHHFFKTLKHVPMLRWLTVLLGAVIIASPFPDELGIALLGITKLKTKRFLVFSFILNTMGILVIVGVGKIF